MIQRPLLAIAFLVAAVPLSADVTIRSSFKSSGVGGLGGSQGTETRQIQGVKAREESDIAFTGKAALFLTGGPRSGTRLVRIDNDRIFQLDHKKKTYRESPIAIEPSTAAPAKDGPSAAPESPSDEKPTHRVKKSDLSVKKTGEKRTHNGFATEETRALMTVEIDEIATGEVTTFIMDNRFWMTPWTPELTKAGEEEAAFGKALAAKMMEKIGGAPAPGAPGSGGAELAMMLGIGGPKVAALLLDLKEKTKDMKGYAVVTSSEWRVKEDPKALARRESERAAETGADPELSSDPTELAGSILGGFAKKKMKDRQAAREKANENDPVFAIYREILAVDVAPIVPEAFEVPAGYTKVK